MHYSYREPQTKSVLNLIVNEPGFKRLFFQERQNRLLTIAWNQGSDQTVTIDGINYVFPEQTVLPLVVNQSFIFSHPETIIAWQFNREFYCIVDHDREVSCVGLLFYGATLPLFLYLDHPEKRKFEALLMVFDDEFSTQDSIQGEMLRMLLKRLIIKLTRLTKDQFVDAQLTEPDLTIIRRFNLLVETHFREFHAVSDYANQLNKSPKTLSNLFAIYNRQSPLQTIHERIALEARRLLLYTDKSAKEITYELGFEEVAHFSRFFKKQVGLPPSEFKNQIGNALAG